MKGKLKNTEFYIGNKKYFIIPSRGKIINIIEYEDHPIWGRRYKIENSNEWFEENCFEYVETN